MSTMYTRVSRSPRVSRAWSRIHNAMSPVPPATSMQRMCPFEPGRRKRDKGVLPEAVHAEGHGVVHDIIARRDRVEYARTSSSFEPSGTVRKPKCVVLVYLEVVACACTGLRAAIANARAGGSWRPRQGCSQPSENSLHSRLDHNPREIVTRRFRCRMWQNFIKVHLNCCN
jgi:hypothetical protein